MVEVYKFYFCPHTAIYIKNEFKHERMVMLKWSIETGVLLQLLFYFFCTLKWCFEKEYFECKSGSWQQEEWKSDNWARWSMLILFPVIQESEKECWLRWGPLLFAIMVDSLESLCVLSGLFRKRTRLFNSNSRTLFGRSEIVLCSS